MKSSPTRQPKRLRSLTLLSCLSAAALAAGSLHAWLASPALAAAATFTVNSTGDGADSDTGDGVCNDGAGDCTLRAAVQQANAAPGPDVINFSIAAGAQTIALSSALPAITDPVTIDATTQPGFSGTPLIVLSGGGPSTGVIGDGLVINAGGSTVRGMVINGIRGHAIKIEGGGGNVVAGNYIGIDASGASRVTNLQNGVFILNSNNNTVGGTSAGSRNVIAGNGSNGVHIAGTSSGNVVQGNYIGLNAAGDTRIRNEQSGVLIFNSSGNTVGGTTAAARNVLSGNFSYGVEIGDGSSGNFVQGNFIGTNAAGTAAVPNNSSGIRVSGTGNVIGGLASSPGAAPGNVVSDNVAVFGTGSVIQGNLIGPDPTGTSSLSRGGFGVQCWGPDTLIGGTQAGARNVISGNAIGIHIANSGRAIVQGNYIGTDISGGAAIPNTDIGVSVITDNNLIGGTTAAARNVISGNGKGLEMKGSNGNAVKGNFIGLDAAGTAAVPNRFGMVLTDVGGGVVVGGDEAGAANVIAFNSDNGIVVDREAFVVGTFSNKNALRRNSIHSNGLLGIDLFGPSAGPPGAVFKQDGVTLNDPGDADAGPNTLQNFPVLLSVTEAGGTRNVQGTLNSTPNTAFTIDFYANAACDLSGHGEGQTYVGSAAVTTDAGGNAAFAAALTPPPGAGSILTATATDPSGNTSEFSACNVGSAPGTFQFVSATFDAPEGGAAATITVTRTLGSAGAATVDFSTGDNTAHAGDDYTPASGTLSFAPGETSKSFTVTILNDALDEDTETINLSLSNPTGGVVLGSQSAAVVRIADNDLLPVLSLTGATVTEGDAGTTDAVFNVTLTPASGRTVSVNFNTQGFSATAGEDFIETVGTLTFNPGETAKTVNVPIIGDTLPEANEAFTLRLSGEQNATFPIPSQNSFLQATGRILDDDGPGIRFSVSNFTASEKAGQTIITVLRRGDTSAPASVEYAAEDGSASSRSDFTLALGRLDFAPGEGEKTFAVLLTDDAFVESPETVALTLSNPSGAPLGVFSQATLTLNSDDTAPPTPAANPINDAHFFVRQHYHDFLNREPDASGFAFWTGQIADCGSNAGCIDFRRVSVSQAFFLSIEFQRTGYQVIRVYKATFTDTAQHPRGLPRLREFLRDTQELQRGVVVGQGNWEQQLQQNTLDYARRWVASAEFVAQFPAGLTAEEYVDKLFQNSEVTPAAGERPAALAAYGAGDTEGRAQALLSVTESGSVYNRQYNPAAVLMQYLGYLRRNPNDSPEPGLNFAGYDFWLTKLNNHSLPGEDVRNEETARARLLRAEMVRSFLVSGEYRGRFGTP